LFSVPCLSISRHANPFGPAWRSSLTRVHAPGAFTSS
jgi:hypothetical protein